MVIHQNQVDDGKGNGGTSRANDASFSIQLVHDSDSVSVSVWEKNLSLGRPSNNWHWNSQSGQMRKLFGLISYQEPSALPPNRQNGKPLFAFLCIIVFLLKDLLFIASTAIDWPANLDLEVD